jgi:NAD(P)-dependent dehydrogenase (short-subunit alcohol dehydrogenase family)
MNVHPRQFDQFSWRRRPAEDVIGSPAVTPSGQLLSTSSSSPQVPIRGINGRFGDVDEVVGTALFLASDDAAFITGHTLAIGCGT